MSSLIRDTALAEVAEWQTIEIELTGAAPGANGARLSPIAQHAMAAAKVAVILGGTSDNASVAAAFTAAESQALVSLISPVSTRETALALAMRTMLIAPAASGTDANRSITFAVGGLGARDCLLAEIEWSAVSATGTVTKRSWAERSVARKVGPTEDVPSSFTLATDVLVVIDGVVFGSIALPDQGTVTAASDQVKLRLKFKN